MRRLKGSLTRKQTHVLYRILLAFTLTAAGVLLSAFTPLPLYVSLPLYFVAYLVIGYDVLLRAWRGILRREVFDENFLMGLATLGALALRDFKEAVAVMLFYQVGELFQSIAVGKSRKSIAKLMDIRPEYANRELDGKTEQVEPDEIAVGDTIVVNPGERVPLDGTLTVGHSTLNMSALTGESLPRDVSVGDSIISGSINLTGVIRVKVSKPYGESTVARILDLVENSVMRKSRSENFITRFARYYTPFVFFSALLLAILPPLILWAVGEVPMVAEWVTRALTFLVISCPCALVISVPLSFFGGIGAASREGILIKGGRDLEALATVRRAVFDKTGTLTCGRFEVTAVWETAELTEKEILSLAAHAESASSHPIAEGIVRAYGEEIRSACIASIEERAGFGVSAVIDGHSVYVGNRRMMQENGIVSEGRAVTGTAVYVALQGQLVGIISVEDVVKETAADAIAALYQSGVNETAMLTGDTEENATRVAKALRLDRYEYGLLPSDKVTAFEAMLADGQKTAFIGDGINDAPVLARADVGIAMGALGSDAAIEAADVVLMDDNPQRVAVAMRLAVRTLRIVRQNIALALGVKGLCLVLSALGYTNMWMAIFADVGVMVLAVLNAMRCLHIKQQ